MTSIQAGAAFPAHARFAAVEGWPGRDAIFFGPPGRAIAIAVELHGSGFDPLRQYHLSRLADLLIAKQIAVLLPRAATPFQLMPELAGGFAWHLPGIPLPGAADCNDTDADDVCYIVQLVETVKRRLQLYDPALFLSGYSGGARFGSYLLTSGRLEWTAAGLVAGLRPTAHGQRRPPPTISFHGVADTINPYAGGTGPRWDIGVEEAARRYALAQGCLPVRHLCEVPGADVHIYRLPDGGDALLAYAVANSGHAWPGARDENHRQMFGSRGDSPNASALIADFFTLRMNARQAPTKRAENQGTAR